MRRRDFITLLGGAAAAWPLAARAQQSQASSAWFPRSTLNSPPAIEQYEAFHTQLGEHGFREGQNLTIDYRGWTIRAVPSSSRSNWCAPTRFDRYHRA